MSDHVDRIVVAEGEMLAYAIDVMERAVALRRQMAEAEQARRPVWGWADPRDVDPLDVLEAAAAFQAFPPTGWGAA